MSVAEQLFKEKFYGKSYITININLSKIIKILHFIKKSLNITAAFFLANALLLEELKIMKIYMTQIKITMSKNKTFIVACISKTAFALLFLIAVSAANAQVPVSPPETTASGCVSGNCINGRGKYVYANGDTYEGDFVNGKRKGQGTSTSEYGEVYTGQFANDKYNGKGKLEGIFSGIYEGDFVDGKRQGQGMLTDIFGAVYTGQFVNDKYNGKGKEKYSSGDVYEGNFVDGMLEGQGTLTLKNGDYYTGEWKNYKRNGYGKDFTKATNTTRQGIWKDDIFISPASQKSEFSQADLDEFNKQNPNFGKEKVQTKKVTVPSPTANECVSGNCVNGKGKYLYPNGDIYEGNWVTGKYNGIGKFKSIFGNIYEGGFVDGKRQGQGIFTYGDGSIYTGQFANNEMNGKGKIKYSDGDIYEGNFVNGTREGQGKLILKNGDYYTGEWKNFKRNGYGKEYIKATKTVREGIWKDSVFVGNSPAKTLKTENDWQKICEPYWSKMDEALKKKDIDSAKKIYAEFNGETKDANNSITVKVRLNSLLKQLYLSEIPQLKDFVESELKRLKYTDKEKEDVKRDNSKGYYV